jgi:recombinational DNA repair protein RecR
MSKTPRTNEMLKRYDTLEDGAAGFMLLRQSIEELETELAEARAEIERLKHCKKCGKFIDIESITCPSCVDNSPVKKRDKLIEQMREALRLALSEARSTHCEQTILAALAAERGE